MLLKLLRTMDRNLFDPVVVSLMDGGEIGDHLQAEGFAVHGLGLKSGMITPGAVWRLRRLARELQPRVIQGWMYHGNLAATLTYFFAPGDPALFWNIRHSVADLGREKVMTRAVIKGGGFFASRPRRIIFNSNVSIDQHAAHGYPANKALMIPNGFDTERFHPDENARVALRDELGVGADAPLIGMVARRHPMKGHEDFLRAAALVRNVRPDVRFVLAGRGVTTEDRVLRTLVEKEDLLGKAFLVGQRSDTPAVFAALDLLCLPSSYGEGFPNVLGEAMACGVPCVATDVGESREIVADTGRIVPPGEPVALAEAMGKMLDLEEEVGSDLAVRCRARILENYSLENIAGRYAELYLSA
jgi:glycosyltransferase involved in cell wall biosynthesis